MNNKNDINNISSAIIGWKIHILFLFITAPIVLSLTKFSCSSSPFGFTILLSCLILMLNVYFYFLLLNYTQRIHAAEMEILMEIENAIKSKNIYLHELDEEENEDEEDEEDE